MGLADGDFERCGVALDAMMDVHRRTSSSSVWLDGMSVSVGRLAGGRVERYAGHPDGAAAEGFVVGVLSLALGKVRPGHLRDRLAWCGRYLTGRDDPTFDVGPENRPDPPPVTRLVVLGTPEDRADFHARHSARPPSGPPSS